MMEQKNEKQKKEFKLPKKKDDKLQTEYNELNDKYLRLLAEVQNIKRRNEEERDRLLKYEGEEILRQLLVTVDNFERAISMDDNNLDDEVSKFLQGFKLIYINLESVLTNSGVTEIDALGKEFDPTKMEAVMTEHILEEEPNIVLDVMQKGYMYKDKVLRSAVVKVNE